MPIQFLNIVFNRYHGAYFPGQEVRGTIEINVESEVNINNISVSICGAGMVHYTTESDTSSKDHTKHETYLQKVTCVYDLKDKAEEEKLLGHGTHSFPFEFKLPVNIPSSFESPEGFVRYSITSQLEGSDLTLQTVKTLFTVNAIVDLNTIPKMKQPTSVWTYHDVFCMCFARGPLSAVVHIPRRGYVPGECILLSAEINNLDRRPVSHVKATLVQVIKYNHKNLTKKLKRMVTEVTRGCVMPYESQFWMEETLLIPPVPASFLEHCKLISIWYKLYFTMCQSEAQNITLKLPITIGTVPLKQYINTFERGTGDAPLPGDDWPSPNHEPCFFGPHNIADSSGDKEVMEQLIFSPQYVTYSAIQEDIELSEPVGP